MKKQSILAWLVVAVYILLAALLVISFSMFGSRYYTVVSLVLMLTGCLGTVLSLACRDSLKSPRLVLYLIVLAAGGLFTALPYV